MDKKTLIKIKERLEELNIEWNIASNWKDKRSRHNKIREVSVAISNYADTLPPEVLGLFDIEVAPAAFNSQFAGEDIGKCIVVLEEMINQLEDR